MWSGPATTASSQQIIATTESAFESFVADNYQFMDLNEFFDWVDTVFKTAPTEVDDWIHSVSVDDLYDRLISKILHKNPEDNDLIMRFCQNLDSDDRKIFYYKNDLIQFVRDHDLVSTLYISFFENVKNLDYLEDGDLHWQDKIEKYGCDASKFKDYEAWNKFVNTEYAMDPNKLPDTIKKDVELFSDLCMKYVYTPYQYFDRVYRLKNLKRRTVTVIDTDSNILALDTWVNFVFDELLSHEYGRSHEKNVFITVNTLTYVLTNVVTASLLQYGEFANVPEEYRPRLNMKNELTKKGSYYFKCWNIPRGQSAA